MTGHDVLRELLVVLGTAAAVRLLFQVLRLPVVLGYVVAGLLIGPHVPIPLVVNVGLIEILSELGVILLMFALGLELRISTLARVGFGAGLTALFEVALVLTVGALLAGAIGFSSTEAVFAGACLAISSTVLVAKAFEELRWKGGFTEVVFAILVFEDLIAIILLTVLTGLATGAGLAPRELAITLGELGGFLTAMMVGGLLVVPRLIKAIARTGQTETLLIVALALCFGFAVLTDFVGYPVALGAFVAGLIVSESGLGHEVLESVKPFRDVFAMMFFVSIGMTIQPSQLRDELPTIFLFTAIVLVFKPIGVGFGSFASGRGVKPAIRAGVSLAQNGELSFVIARIGIAAGIVRPSLLAIAVGVTCLTTLTSSVMIRRSESIASWTAARLPERIGMFVSFYESWLDRLRSRQNAAWRRVRRPVIVLVLDTAAVITIVIGGSIIVPRFVYSAGLDGLVGNAIIISVVVAASAPFGLGAVRRTVQIARLLALIVIPAGRSESAPLHSGPAGRSESAPLHSGPAGRSESAPLHSGPASGEVDLGRAPRRALTLMLELAIAAVVTIPVVAAIQPFTGNLSIIIGGVVVFLIAITYRSIVDFTQHVRAGSELILELMHSGPNADVPTDAPTGTQVESMLPGFGGMVSVSLDEGSAAIGKSLAEINLRARTGATVLAIGRGGGGFATPTPTEPLHAGDVLALTGSDEALAAAKLALGPPGAVPRAETV